MKDKIKRNKLKRFVARRLLKYYLFYLLYFNRAKLKRNFLSRKDRGNPDCKECGRCCVNCTAWDKDSKLCRIVKSRDYLCREYPITPIQLKLDKLEGVCRFYWEEK